MAPKIKEHIKPWQGDLTTVSPLGWHIRKIGKLREFRSVSWDGSKSTHPLWGTNLLCFL